MAIATSVALRTRGEVKRVEINGVPMLGTGDSPGILSIEWGDSYDTPPYANIELNTVPSWMRSGMSIKIYAGINNDMPIQFTGFISALPGEEPEFLRDKIILDGATITVGTPPDTSQSSLNAVATLVGADIRPALPSGSHIAARYQNRMIWSSTKLSTVALRILTDRGRVPGHPAGDLDSQMLECSGPLYNLVRQLEYEDTELDVGGMTDIAVIRQELDRVGITNYTIDTPPDGAYTLASDATIDGGSGIDRLADLIGVAGTTGMQFHQTPGGIVVLRAVDFFPAPTAAFTYTTNAAATAFITDTSGVTELAVTFNPTITKGMTGQFTIPHLNVNGRYFVYGVRHVLPRMSPGSTESEGATTYLRLRGGNRLGGTVAVNPVASFTFSIRRQVMNTGVRLIYTLNAESSVALDGTISSYAWTITTGDSLSAITTVPAHPLSGKVVTFVVNPSDIINGVLTSTLTVTGSNGLTHATALELPNASTDSFVTIAPFGVAGGIRRSVTPDGGETYNNTTPSSSRVSSAIGARPADGVNSGHFAVGHTDGSIDVTRDFGVTYTAALAAVGSAINNIQWDWRDTTICWALTENAKLYMSNDSAATFFLLVDFRTVTYGGFGGTTAGAIGNTIGCPAGGGLYIGGGTGAGVPLITFNTAPFSGGAWIRQTFTGDLLTDITTPADATMRIEDATAPGDGMSHIILSWASGGGASLVAIYYTTGQGDTAAWSRATGLTAGLKTGRVILSDAPLAGQYLRHAMFADRDTWHTTNGIAWTRTADVLPAGYTPNHGLFESDVLTGLIGMQDVFLVAANDAAGNGGIFKSVGNGFTVLEAIYGAGATYATPTYVVGEKPAQIAIGAVGSTVGGQGDLIALTTGAATNTVTKLLSTAGTWSALVSVAGSTQAGSRVFPITDQLIFATDEPPGPNTVGGGLFRSIDGGANWTPTSLTAGVAVCRAADGRLWAIERTAGAFNQVKIYRDAKNDGTSWTLIATIGDGTTQSREGLTIVAHPLNGDIVAVWGPQTDGAAGGFLSHTVNGTSTGTPTFSTDTANAPARRQSQGAFFFTILSNGRWVLGTYNTGGSTAFHILTTDDKGATAWTTRYTSAIGAGNVHLGCGVQGNKLVVMCYIGPAGNGGLPLVSNDAGATWAVLAPTQTWEAFTGAAALPEAAAYDPISDALYVANDNVSTFKVVMFTPCTDAGVWSNVSRNIPDNQFMGQGSMAVIP